MTDMEKKPMYRIQERLYSSNIIEKLNEKTGKYEPYVAPFPRKELGDILANFVFTYLMSTVENGEDNL